MLRALLARLNLWFYVKHNRETTHLSVRDEINGFLFRSPEDVLKLIKGLLSYNTISYYRAESEADRLMTKGMAQALQVLKDGYVMAMAITEKESDPAAQEKRWDTFRKANKLF